MKKEGHYFMDPLTIMIDDSGCHIVCDTTTKQTLNIKQGIMFSSAHYGFMIMNGYRESFATEGRIVGVGYEGGIVKVFELGKRMPWIIENGRVIAKARSVDAFVPVPIDKTYIAMENDELFGGEAIIQNPITVRLDEDSTKSVIVNNDESTVPLIPGALFGGNRFGFRLVREAVDGSILEFPTQKRIDAVGMSSQSAELQIFEEGKYYPWTFKNDGTLVSKSKYNVCSRKDVKVMEEFLDDPRRSITIKKM